MTTGVVLARAGGRFRVHTADGERTAVLRGKLKLPDDDRLVAGDVVELAFHGDGPATVERVFPRRSMLARRRATGGHGARRAQPIAANVDQVVVVAAARDPEPSARMLDRFLVIAEANGLPAALVVNKVELDRVAVEALERRYARAGYQVLPTSVKTPEGLPALRDLLRGRESVFTGASGVG
jgi:ribosome biogenesis GTPase